MLASYLSPLCTELSLPMTASPQSWLLSMAFLLLSGCSASSRPFDLPARPSGGVFQTTSQNGTVLFETPAELMGAQVVAEAIDRYYDKAAAALGCRRNEPVDVWLIPGWRSLGSTNQDRIIFDSSPRSLSYADLTLVHEFVHWHSEGSVLEENLPHSMIEGICEYIAISLVERGRAFRLNLYSELLEEAWARGDALALSARLSIDKAEWLSLDRTTRYELYALSYTIVARIGLDRVCEEARIGPLSVDDMLRLACPGEDGVESLFKS